MNRARSLIALSFALLVTACPGAEPICPEACEGAFVCDPSTLTCVPAELPRYAQPLPGRAVRVASAIGRVWTASIDPVEGHVIVAEFVDGTDPDARVLEQFATPADKRVAIATSRRMIAVAWLGPQARYTVAYRSLPGENSRWEMITATNGEPYLGTESFDLELVDTRGIAIAFRDRDETLRLLQAPDPAQPFVLETIDAGGPADDGTACPDALRAGTGLGVGVDVDLEWSGSRLLAAYHDDDCGDLRFARRTSSRWALTVVDGGVVSVETEATRGVVGRWPSIAVDAAGEVAIAYHDVSRGRLLYAREDDGRFEIEVADPGVRLDAFSRERKTIVGAFARLSRSDDGTATVTYLDGSELDLKVARREAGSGQWSERTLLADGAVGFFADHVVELGAGRFVVSERLVPSAEGLTSELVMQREVE